MSVKEDDKQRFRQDIDKWNTNWTLSSRERGNPITAAITSAYPDKKPHIPMDRRLTKKVLLDPSIMAERLKK